MPQTKFASTFNRLRQWVKEVEPDATKEATARGETTHPTKDAPDGQQKPNKGFRYSENEKDVKEDVPANVEEAGSPESGSQEDQQLQIGTKKTEVGKDKSVEENYEGRPSNTPTSHPANVEHGPKYSFDLTSLDGVKQAASALSDLADEINAEIAVEASSINKGAQTAGTHQVDPPATNKQADTLQAAQAGYELASLMGLSKDAADQNAQAVIEYTIKEAAAAADRVGNYLTWYAKNHKQAAGEEVPPEAAAAMAGAGAEEAPGGGGMPGEMPPGAGAPPGGEMPPDGGGAPPGAGGGGDEQALQELAQALAEMGITPEQLLQMAQQAHGGAGGAPSGGAPGGPPMPGGDQSAPPEMPPAPGGEKAAAAHVATKVASEIHDYMRTGKFQFKAYKNASERLGVDTMKSHIMELTRRLGRK